MMGIEISDGNFIRGLVVWFQMQPVYNAPDSVQRMMNIADRLDSVWPADAKLRYGTPVEKFTGEARWEGVVVSAYETTAGKLRYVVEVDPQGFQMIASPEQLRPLPRGTDEDTAACAAAEGERGQRA